ncbi:MULTISPECIES: SDR family oxidoreductase [unclassified Mycobacterium]|uniref:SDR family oxidoreductase n=1 Tax=unclassified Mycobacterium TaxID=2642494 RepID=UPI0029C7A60D|nr:MULTISPECIES: SDR family oxidoreductase [unclassified Mycobacterium]
MKFISSGRVALVTGANKGVGRAIAQQLGELGMTVWLGARDPDRGLQAERELREARIDARHVALDVTDEASARLAAKHIEDQSGRLDVLVNCAGITRPWHPPSQTPLEDLQATFATNVCGVVTVTNAVLPLLRLSNAARIVNVSSVLGSLTAAVENHDPSGCFPDGQFPVLLSYSTSKAALNSLTVMYANELRGDGILVNAVAPGWVPTDATGHTGAFSLEQGAQMPVRMATLDDGGPTGTYTSSTADEEGVTLPW